VELEAVRGGGRGGGREATFLGMGQDSYQYVKLLLRQNDIKKVVKKSTKHTRYIRINMGIERIHSTYMLNINIIYISVRLEDAIGGRQEAAQKNVLEGLLAYRNRYG
jgi:hypothetical protein